MITSLILAAGEGSRMGRLKQLLPWKNSTILDTVIDNIAQCELVDDEIRVVLGAEADRVRKKLSGRKDKRLRLLKNPDYKKGMLSSVWTGLKGLPKTTEYVILSLSDQPLITGDIINKVLREVREKKPDFLIPTSEGRRGHPLVFSTDYVDEIFNLPGPGGLKRLLERYPDKIYHYEVDDKKILIDLDYYEEYKKYYQ